MAEQTYPSFLHKNKGEIVTFVDVAETKIQNTDSVVHIRLPFVHKLYLMLNDMEAKGYDHIISWIGDGKAFKIHNPSVFEASIQPQYFRQSRLASFIRQVSREGFQSPTRDVSDVNTDSCCDRIPILFVVLWIRICQDRRQKQHVFWGVRASRLSKR